MHHRDVFDDNDLDVLKDLTAPGIEVLFDGIKRATQRSSRTSRRRSPTGSRAT